MDIPQPSYQPNSEPTPDMPSPIAPIPRTHWVALSSVVVLILAVSAGAYFFGIKKSEVAESPTPSVSSDPTNSSMRFNSKYFNLSFDVPAGFEVYDSQNYVAVAKGKYETYEIGSNNAFLTIQRFDQYFTKEKAIADARTLLKNVRESKITIDGSEFLKIEGDDYGRYEGESAGKIIEVFFEKSHLHIESRPNNPSILNFDILPIANEIISTIKFSSTADWKTYRNDEYGFEVKYPEGWPYKIIPASGLFFVQFEKQPKDEFDEFPDHVIVQIYDSSKTPSVEQRGGYINIKTSTFVGLPAKTFDNQIQESQGRQERSFIEFSKDGKLFQVSYQRDADMLTINQILSTFKFIDKTSNTDICLTLAGTTFQSVEKHETGRGPNGGSYGYWHISFSDSNNLSWQYSDIGVDGNYSCKDNVIKATANNRSINAYYDPKNSILNWDGLPYKLQ